MNHLGHFRLIGGRKESEIVVVVRPELGTIEVGAVHDLSLPTRIVDAQFLENKIPDH